MTRSLSPDAHQEAKLLGILLSGVFGQTRPDGSLPAGPFHADTKPSGVHRIALPEADDEGPG